LGSFPAMGHKLVFIYKESFSPNKAKVKSKKALIKKKKNGLRATKFIYGMK
jgi:hypothetical protein